MAKASIDTGQTAQPVHTRTTAGSEESQVVVVGIDGSDSVVGADIANGLDVDVTRVQGTVTVLGPLTDTQLRATPVPVSGTVTASGPLTDTQLRAVAVPVSGTFYQGTQPVSAASLPLPTGAATETTVAAVNTATGAQGDAEAAANGSVIAILKRLRTLLSGGLPAALAASGGLKVDLAGTGANATAVKVDGSAVVQPVSGPITDAQIRATPLPVSGTVTASGPLTDTQLRATAVPVSLASLPTLAAGVNNIGDVDVLTLPAGTVAGGASLPAGTNNIGDVDVLTLPALVAGNANIGDVDVASVATGQGKTLLFAAITQAAAGTTQLVAADAAAKIKVVSYVVVLDAAGSFKFADGVADLSGVMPVAANGGVSAVGQPSSHLLETAAVNRALSITTVTGKAFGHIAYIKEA